MKANVLSSLISKDINKCQMQWSESLHNPQKYTPKSWKKYNSSPLPSPNIASSSPPSQHSYSSLNKYEFSSGEEKDDHVDSGEFEKIRAITTSSDYILSSIKSQERFFSLFKPGKFQSDYHILGTIGKGGFGTVYSVLSNIEGLEYAIKCVKFRDQRMPTEKFEKVFQEVTTLAKLDHPNIVRYYGAWFEVSQEVSEDSNEETDSEESSQDTFSNFSENKQIVAYNYSSFDRHSFEQFNFQMTNNSYSRSFSQTNSYSLELSENSHQYSEYSFDNSKKSPFESKLNELVFSNEEFENMKEFSQTSNNNNNSFSIMKENSISLENKAVILNQCTAKRKNSKQRVNYLLFIQMQLYQSKTLKELLKMKFRVVNRSEIFAIFKQIVKGLIHIHDKGVIHRDLKPSNIFLAADNKVKIGDFGLSRDITPFVTNSPLVYSGSSGNLTKEIGTPGYTAPELFYPTTAEYGPEVDIYSLGIILFEMFVYLFLVFNEPLLTELTGFPCFQQNMKERSLYQI